MGIKGYFKNTSFFNQLVIFFAVFLLGNIIASILFSIFFVFKIGFSIEIMTSILENPMIMYQEPNTFRAMLFFNHLGTFFFPALFLGYLFSDDKKIYLKVETGFSVKVALLVVLSMLVVLPFLNLTIQLNEMMKFPEWMKPLEDWMIASEESAKSTMEPLLNTNSWKDLVFNLIIIGVIAAIGEEFLFRGVLQNIFEKKIVNKHIVIWSVAIIFSAIHLQFYGFIPRMLMGAYFGYLLMYTRSIWAPVLAHLTNNAFAVLISFKYSNTADLEKMETVGTGQDWWLALISLALWAYFFSMIIKTCRKDLFSDNHQEPLAS